jgi:hypothetical protein
LADTITSTILLVESDDEFRTLMREALRARNFRVIAEACSVGEAELRIRELKKRMLVPDFAVIASYIGNDGSDGASVAWCLDMEDLGSIKRICLARTPDDELGWCTLIVHKCATEADSVSSLMEVLEMECQARAAAEPVMHIDPEEAEAADHLYSQREFSSF